MIFIKGSASLGVAMLIGLSAPLAQAGYVVDLTQQGSNVVATGSGAIDLTGLRLFFSRSNVASILPNSGYILTGPVFPDFSSFDAYIFVLGPKTFGSGAMAAASSGSGDLVGIVGIQDELFVPHGYVSDSALSDTATYNSQSFSSLGVTPGRYEWTWGPGANQNFTLVATVPESSTWAIMLLGFAGLGFMRYRSAGRRRRTMRNA